MKTESENSREMTATRPSATMIERIAISTGTSPANDGPENEHEDDQRGGQTEGELALLEIRLRLLPEVVAGRVEAGDADLERAAVRLLHHLLDRVCARVAADLDGDEGRVAVARDSYLTRSPHLAGRSRAQPSDACANARNWGESTV